MSQVPQTSDAAPQSGGMFSNINWDQVADKILPVNGGIYQFKFEKVPTVTFDNNKNLDIFEGVVTIQNDCPMKGRGIGIYQQMNEIGKTFVKRIFLACGIRPNAQTTPADLLGREFVGKVEQEIYQDKNTKEHKVASRFRDAYIAEEGPIPPFITLPGIEAPK